jgi:hypothetical protein
VSPRGVLAVAHSKLLQLGRSPILVAVLAAFGLLVVSLPASGGSSADRVRQTTAWMLAAASALLCVTALVVPVSGGAPALRFRESRLLGQRAANLGHGAAALAFLVFLAGVLALVAWVVILLRFGNPDGRFEGSVVRRVLWRSPAAIDVSRDAPWVSQPIPASAQGGTVLVELQPRFRFVPGGPTAASAPASRAGAALEIELSWRADAGRKRTRRIAAASGRPVTETLEVPPGARSLVLGIACDRPGVEVVLDAGAFAVLGARAGCFAVLSRALLVVALAASVLGIVTQWFSNFVSPLIALAAALTLALAAAIGGAVFGWNLVPFDPVAEFRRGHETAWAEVLRAAVAAGAAVVAGSLLAFGRRAGDEA